MNRRNLWISLDLIVAMATSLLTGCQGSGNTKNTVVDENALLYVEEACSWHELVGLFILRRLRSG